MSESETQVSNIREEVRTRYGGEDDWKEWLYNHPWVVRFVILEILIMVAAAALAFYGGSSQQASQEAVPQILSGISVVWGMLVAAMGLVGFAIYAVLKRYERRGAGGMGGGGI